MDAKETNITNINTNTHFSENDLINQACPQPAVGTCLVSKDFHVCHSCHIIVCNVTHCLAGHL